MKSLIFTLILTVLFIGSADLALASGDCPDGTPEGTVCLKNPLGKGRTEATDIIGVLIRGVLTILGSVSLLMLVWGGFQWLTSAGNTEKVEKGTSTMVWAVIGVIIVLSSYILVSTLTNFLSKGTP